MQVTAAEQELWHHLFASLFAEEMQKLESREMTVAGKISLAVREAKILANGAIVELRTQGGTELTYMSSPARRVPL